MEIDTNKFFQIGKYVFFLIVVLSTINLFVIHKTLNIWQILVQSAFIFFYFITMLYFIWLSKMQTPMQTEELDNDKIVKDALDLLEKERQKHGDKE